MQTEKDIGVTIDTNLKFNQHIQLKINMSNQLVELIGRSFKCLDYKTFCLLFKSLVRPHLEYVSSVWNPYPKKDIEATENVQRRTTQILPKGPSI